MSRINGLGAIKTVAIPIPKMKLVAGVVGASLATVGVLGSYHAFTHAWRVQSGWAKLGLAIAGLAAGVLTLDGVLIGAVGVGLLPGVDDMPSFDGPDTVSVYPFNRDTDTPRPTGDSEFEHLPMNGVRRLRGIGAMVQPDVMVGQDHWLDRQYADRYSEWWVGPNPRR